MAMYTLSVQGGVGMFYHPGQLETAIERLSNSLKIRWDEPEAELCPDDSTLLTVSRSASTGSARLLYARHLFHDAAPPRLRYSLPEDESTIVRLQDLEPLFKDPAIYLETLGLAISGWSPFAEVELRNNAVVNVDGWDPPRREADQARVLQGRHWRSVVPGAPADAVAEAAIEFFRAYAKC